jgi:hypothetical protein
VLRCQPHSAPSSHHLVRTHLASLLVPPWACPLRGSHTHALRCAPARRHHCSTARAPRPPPLFRPVCNGAAHSSLHHEAAARPRPGVHTRALGRMAHGSLAKVRHAPCARPHEKPKTRLLRFTRVAATPRTTPSPRVRLHRRGAAGAARHGTPLARADATLTRATRVVLCGAPRGPRRPPDPPRPRARRPPRDHGRAGAPGPPAARTARARDAHNARGRRRAGARGGRLPAPGALVNPNAHRRGGEAAAGMLFGARVTLRLADIAGDNRPARIRGRRERSRWFTTFIRRKAAGQGPGNEAHAARSSLASAAARLPAAPARQGA